MPTVTKAPPYSNYDYEVNYSDLGDRDTIDTAAITDIRNYCTPTQWFAITDAAELVNTKQLTINQLNFMMAVAGISGRPFHAFCRRYCLAAYRKWMASEPDPIETDEQGFATQEPNQ